MKGVVDYLVASVLKCTPHCSAIETSNEYFSNFLKYVHIGYLKLLLIHYY